MKRKAAIEANRLSIAVLVLLFVPSVFAVAPETKKLQIYFVDVEGGQSTLFVTPTGQSLLVDSGWPGGRDAERIMQVVKKAGITAIDYMVVSHYHIDHAGGVGDIVARIPVKTFIDHGPNTESAAATAQNYEKYLPLRSKAKYILARPGDRLPITGMSVQVVSAAGQTITKPLPGAGAPNPLCESFEPKDGALVGGENQQSVAMVITFGRFRMADFADLTWNREHDLACPNNLIGNIDLYLVSHHGREISSLPMLVYAMHPMVAVMNNGANKGGDVATFERLAKSPGLENLWQLHFAVGAKDLNSPKDFIANLGTAGTATTGVPDEVANYISCVVNADGSFTMTNSRNGFHKTYRLH